MYYLYQTSEYGVYHDIPLFVLSFPTKFDAIAHLKKHYTDVEAYKALGAFVETYYNCGVRELDDWEDHATFELRIAPNDPY